MRGSNHTLDIRGDGTAKSAGSTIRFYLSSPGKTWFNTELTIYARRVSEQSNADSSTGFEFQARTADGHTEDGSAKNAAGLPQQCDGHSYGYSLRYDGRALFEKELRHPTYTSQVSRNIWSGGALPRNQWIGIKVITYSKPDGGVKLELALRSVASLTMDDFSLVDLSTGPTPATLHVITPNGGESLTTGSTYDLRWDTTGPWTSVALAYSTNLGSTWTTIVTGAPNTGRYTWTVPTTTTTQGLVRVSSTSAPFVSDTSDAAFSIVPPPRAPPFRWAARGSTTRAARTRARAGTCRPITTRRGPRARRSSAMAMGMRGR